MTGIELPEKLKTARPGLESLYRLRFRLVGTIRVSAGSTAMTEAGWRGCDDPKPMLDFLEIFSPFSLTPRKLRLLAVACCRRIWRVMDEQDRKLVQLVERYVEGRARKKDLRAAHDEDSTYGAATRAAFHAAHPFELRVRILYQRGPRKLPLRQVLGIVHAATEETAFAAADPRDRIDMYYVEYPPRRRRHASARALQGRADRPGSAGPRPVRLSLRVGRYGARLAHAGGRFARPRDLRPPDVREDAGTCPRAEKVRLSSPHVLDHCGQRARHARGCWLVDMLLEKE